MKAQMRYNFLIPILMSILQIHPLQAQEATSDATKDAIYKFAVDLMQEGDYYRAIGEFKRYLFAAPTGVYAGSATINIGLSYFNAGRYDDVISWHKQYKAGVLVGLSLTSNLLLGRSYYRMQNYERALDIFLRETNIHESTGEREVFRYYSGLSYVKLDRYPEGEKAFKAIASSSEYYSKAQYYASILATGDRYTTKSQFKAGALAIIPGAGYAYCGYPRTALSSLLINGLLLWSAYSAFDNDNAGAGGILSMLFLGFYSGNIYGSVQSAKRYNTNQRMCYLAQFYE